MYVILDINGTLVQRSNSNITEEQVIEKLNKFKTNFEFPLIYTMDENIYNKLENQENFKAIIKDNNIIDIIPGENSSTSLEYLKQYKISLSKQQLLEFLKNNPLEYNGKHYSATQEKQSLLANALQVYQMKTQLGLPAILKWNATGEECVEWTIESLTMLALKIAEYVEPLVAKQQLLEVQIRNCTTKEELDLIEINYGKI